MVVVLASGKMVTNKNGGTTEPLFFWVVKEFSVPMPVKKLGDVPTTYSPEKETGRTKRPYKKRASKARVNEVRRTRYGLSHGVAYLLQAYVEIVLQDLRTRNHGHTAKMMTVEQLVGAIVTTYLVDHSEEIRERFAKLQIERLGPFLQRNFTAEERAAITGTDPPEVPRVDNPRPTAKPRANGRSSDIGPDGVAKGRKAYPAPGWALPKHLRRKARSAA